MSLDNLVGISLERMTADAGVIGRLLSAASRNIADYSGDIIPPSLVKACVAHTKALHTQVVQWIEKNRPELLVY